MDFSFLSNYFVMGVIAGCVVVGYIIKHSLDFIPNKCIPVILAVTGAVLNIIASGLTLENVIYGAIMGLASTGMHQAFTQFIGNADMDGSENKEEE